MDGCASHYSLPIVATAAKLDVLLVCLSANATHLLQPLDVIVFSSLKGKMPRLIDEFVEEDSNGGYLIDKSTALRLGSLAWKRCNFSANIATGFV